MAKLTLLLATFALLVLLANASIYRTTVELDEEPDDNQQQRCRHQFQSQQRLRACQRVIRRWSQGGGPMEDVEDEIGETDEIEEVVEPDQARRPPTLQRCCRQLRNVSPFCRCPSLRQAVQSAQQQQGQVGPQQVGHMYRVASRIPAICNPQPMRCPFRQQQGS
uniref:2S albumin n=1 Tax=Moringa oleifera TaxID=3735 RepID=W5S3M0_MOROL|nr:2S albumin precursor [Moringa oleifera]